MFYHSGHMVCSRGLFMHAHATQILAVTSIQERAATIRERQLIGKYASCLYIATPVYNYATEWNFIIS